LRRPEAGIIANNEPPNNAARTNAAIYNVRFANVVAKAAEHAGQGP
jgi:hypothetical protein